MSARVVESYKYLKPSDARTDMRVRKNYSCITKATRSGMKVILPKEVFHIGWDPALCDNSNCVRQVKDGDAYVFCRMEVESSYQIPWCAKAVEYRFLPKVDNEDDFRDLLKTVIILHEDSVQKAGCVKPADEDEDKITVDVRTDPYVGNAKRAITSAMTGEGDVSMLERHIREAFSANERFLREEYGVDGPPRPEFFELRRRKLAQIRRR